MNSFAVRLQEERKRLNINQEAFGALAGVSRTAQSNYELGLRTPDITYLEAIKSSGVDICYLLTGNKTAAGTINSKVEGMLLMDAFDVVSKRLKKHDVSLEKRKEAAWLLYQIYKENEMLDEQMVESVINLLEG
ncbi:hypothetical protein AAEX37_00995 [Oligella sp. MSHR50489EDL]